MLRITKILVIVVLLFTTISSAQVRPGSVEFDVGDLHSMIAFAEAPLSWDENDVELVNVTISLEDFPTNDSSIQIRLIQFFTVEDTPGAFPESQSVNTTEFEVTPQNRTIFVSQFLEPPASADRFYINITITAYPVGGGAVQDRENYSFRFPEDDTIFVSRDNLVPVVNLYGFPPGSYFRSWMPVYLTVLVLFSTPVLVTGYYRLSEVVRNRRQETEEEETTKNE